MGDFSQSAQRTQGSQRRPLDRFQGFLTMLDGEPLQRKIKKFSDCGIKPQGPGI
jgi:hypothetical protein